MSTPQVWLITGCSSGIGRETVSAALTAGHKVIATARHTASLKELEDRGASGLFLDVTAPSAELAKTMEKALGIYGHIDILANNAGQIMFGAVEETSEEEVNRIFQVNLFAPVNLIRVILPHMRERKSGTIINFGSTGGILCPSAIASYAASKSALKAYTKSLNSESRHLGIRAVYLEMGGFRTEILDPKVKMLHASRTVPEYHTPGSGVSTSKAVFSAVTGNEPGDPKKAAEAIVRVCSGKDDRGIPGLLAMGSDTLAVNREYIQSLAENLEKWEDVSQNTDFDHSTGHEYRVSSHSIFHSQ